MRHVGKLPEDFCRMLKLSDLRAIAITAARYRSDFARCGTATALIRRWVVTHKSEAEVLEYDRYYLKAWEAEKAARKRGESARPDNRPAVAVYDPRARARSRTPFEDLQLSGAFGVNR